MIIYLTIFILIILILLTIIYLKKVKHRKIENYSYLKILINQKGSFNQNDVKSILNKIYSDINNDPIELIINYQPMGINFILKTKEDNINNLVNIFRSYDQNLDLEINQFKDDLNLDIESEYIKTISLLTKKKFIFPFYIEDITNDPLSVLTLNLSKINPNDNLQIRFRLKKYKSFRIKYYKNYLLSGKKISNLDYSSPFIIISAFKYLFLTLLKIIIILLKIIESFDQKQNNRTKEKSFKVYDQNISRSLDKLYDGLYKTDFRIILKSSYLYRIKEMEYDFKNFINSLNKNNFQKFKFSSKFDYLRILKPNILSSNEIAIFYRLPNVNNLNKYFEFNNYKKLYPTVNHRRDNDKYGADIVLGLSHDPKNPKFGLSEEDRARHLLIIGTTGSGKSSLIYNLILQDIQKNHGVCLIDPHGDLANKIINNLNPKQLRKLVDISASNLNNIKINLLENKYKVGTKEYNRQNEIIIEQVSAIFKKLFNDKKINSSRIDYLLRNALHTLLLSNNFNLFKVFDLFTDKKFLNETILNLKDQRLKNFWEEEYKKAGDYQKIKMTFGVSSKIGRLLFSTSFRSLFDCELSNINFSDIIGKHQIIIANLAKGEFGEDLSNLIGLFLMSKIQIEVMSNTSVEQKLRPKFYLYIDEFQNYINHSFCQLLAEVRKYGLYVSLAEQSTSMQESELTNKLLANISNYAVFKLINIEDQKLFHNYFSPLLSKNDFLNIPNFNFYFSSYNKKDSSPVSLKLP